MTAERIPAPTIATASEAHDVVTPSLAARFLATLGRDPGHLRDGDPAPLGLHWCLAPEVPLASELADDGIASGGIIPTLELPRRVWGGVEIAFAAPVRLGEPVRRRSRVVGIARKTGRAGALAFVRIEHAFTSEGRPRLTEIQTIAYREADTGPRPDTEPPAPVSPGRVLRRLTPDPAMLFRFSALTFNAHRIHYDLPYVRDVEGYAGLLVHGTLTAALLLDAAATSGIGAGPIAGIALRATAPVTCGDELVLDVDGSVLRACAAGRVAMTATIRP